MKTLILVLVLVFSAIYGVYFYNFPAPLLAKQDAWGQFGDFVGGTLNPILSFITIYILYRTIILQRLSLEKTNEALQLSQNTYELSRTELTKSSEILESQNKLIQLQKFEGAFFELSKLIIEGVNTASYSYSSELYKGSSGLDSIIYKFIERIEREKNSSWIEDFFDENENFYSLIKLTSGIFSFVNKSTLSHEEKHTYLLLLSSILPSGFISAICFIRVFSDWPLVEHFDKSGFFELSGILETYSTVAEYEKYKSIED